MSRLSQKNQPSSFFWNTLVYYHGWQGDTSLEAVDSEGNSLLYWVIKNAPTLVPELLSFDADASSFSLENDLLCEVHSTALLQVLLRHKPIADNQVLLDNTLFFNIALNRPEHVAIVLHAGADACAKDSQGWSCLTMACSTSTPETVERMLTLLLDRGADRNDLLNALAEHRGDKVRHGLLQKVLSDYESRCLFAALPSSSPPMRPRL